MERKALTQESVSARETEGEKEREGGVWNWPLHAVCFPSQSLTAS